MIRNGNEGLGGPAVICLGLLHDRLGGPAATATAIFHALEAAGHSPVIIGFATGLPVDIAVPERQRITFPMTVRGLRRYLLEVRKAKVVVCLGIWHLAFAIIALVPWQGDVRKFLVPTNSLSPWDLSRHRAAKKLLKPVLAVCLRRFDGVVFASTGERNEASPAIGPSRALVIPHAVRIPVATAAPSPAHPINVLSVGRIAEQKDLPLFLEACSLVEGCRPIICGDSDDIGLVDSLKLHAAELGLEVDWRGWLDRKQLACELMQAACVVVTSVSENFCHVAAESLALGVPVIMVNRIASSSDFESCPLVVVTEPDTESVSKAIEASLHRPVSSEARLAGMHWVDDHNSASTFNDRWRQLLSARPERIQGPTRSLGGG